MRAVLALLLLAACDRGGIDDTGRPDDTGDSAESDSDTHEHDTSDTSDTGHDTSDTGHDTSDTGHGKDTGDTADTGHHDTGDTGDTADTDTGTDGCDVIDTGFPVVDGLPDLLPLTPSNVRLGERVVTEADCAWVEGCVGGLGRRRLLRFDGSIANVGDGDLAYGLPEHHPDTFEYSLCHGHYHFTDFASFDLRDDQGAVVASGHKQAFCLTDSGRYLTDDPTVSGFPSYNCNDQGISRGWFDVYGGNLDCQWVDVTDVPPGDYLLRLEIDPSDVIAETDDANNVVTVQVTVPTTDITRACGVGDGPSLSRDCDWHAEATRLCSPGEQITLGCYDGPACGAGCVADPMLRVCEGQGDQCLAGGAWGSSDDACSQTCPRTSFPCPPSGVYTTWTALYGASGSPSCDVSVTTGTVPDPTTPCAGGVPDGDLRECGWTEGLSASCDPGDAIWVGCDPYTCGLDVCPGDDVPPTLDGLACSGDPMLRACHGDAHCDARDALSLNEDACRRSCPAAIFTCPAEGSFTVLVAPERNGRAWTCDLGYASVSDVNVPTGGP